MTLVTDRCFSKQPSTYIQPKEKTLPIALKAQFLVMEGLNGGPPSGSTTGNVSGPLGPIGVTGELTPTKIVPLCRTSWSDLTCTLTEGLARVSHSSLTVCLQNSLLGMLIRAPDKLVLWSNNSWHASCSTVSALSWVQHISEDFMPFSFHWVVNEGSISRILL